MDGNNTKPVDAAGTSKKAKPQNTTDVKAPAATATSTSKVLTLVVANKGDDKDAKDTKQIKETIAAETVLTLVPAISDVARRTKKEDEAAKVVNMQNTKALIDLLFALSAENTSNVDSTKLLILEKDTINIVLQYLLLNQLFYDMTAIPIQLSTLGFFNTDEKDFSKAMVVAEQASLAASLAQIETQIRANPKTLITTSRLNYHLEGMPAPLVIEGTPEQIAIILLDISLPSQGNHPVLDIGLANLLRTLREELLPDTLPLAREQAAVAAPALDENAEKEMDKEQLPILNQAFDFIKANNTEAAVKAVRDYIKNIKPEVITNYIYFLKLLRLVGNAFNVLAGRGGEINGQWYGTQGDQYCFKVIGLAIEMAFGERMRRQLESGIGEFLYFDRVALRPIINAAKRNSSFLQSRDGSLILGHSSYYDSIGRADCSSSGLAGARHGFRTGPPSSVFLLCSNYISIAESLRRVTEPTAYKTLTHS